MSIAANRLGLRFRAPPGVLGGLGFLMPIRVVHICAVVKGKYLHGNSWGEARDSLVAAPNLPTYSLRSRTTTPSEERCDRLPDGPPRRPRARAGRQEADAWRFGHG